MRQPELDILTAMLDTHPGISDLVFSVGRPLQVESFGELKQRQRRTRAVRTLTRLPDRADRAQHHRRRPRHLLRELLTRGACDCSYALGERRALSREYLQAARQFRDRHAQGAERNAHARPRSACTPIFRDMAAEKNGLILVTGATGSGKTTTLTAMLNEINETQAVHVVTLEDPIEFVHQHKKRDLQPARTRRGFRRLSQRPALRPAAGAEGHPRR